MLIAFSWKFYQRSIIKINQSNNQSINQSIN